MADKVKTCNRCDEEQPLDHEHFQKSNKTGDGFTNVCRKCSKPKGPKKKAANQAPRKSRRKRPTLSPEKGSPSPQNQNASLILDLTDYPEVVEHLAEAARINIRTLNHQAIAYIVAGLKKEPSGTASTAQENQDDRPAEPGQG